MAFQAPLACYVLENEPPGDTIITAYFNPETQTASFQLGCNKGQICLIWHNISIIGNCLPAWRNLSVRLADLALLCFFKNYLQNQDKFFIFISLFYRESREKSTGTPFAFCSGRCGNLNRVVNKMPIYEYECTDCGNRFEILQGVNEKPDLHCESCNGSSIRRILSPGAFVFKGKGFYATDYKTKEQKKEKAETPACKACSEAGGCPAEKKTD